MICRLLWTLNQGGSCRRSITCGLTYLVAPDGFQLIPILPRSLSIVHRPSSDIAYLLVLSRSLEMKQRAHCLMQICWGDRKWTTATMLPTFCNWYTLREFLQPIVTSLTGVKMDVSINGDFLDESLVEVVDGSVVSVRLSEGFSMSLCNDLQEFLNRHVNLFHLPPNTTGDTDVGLKAFVPQGRTSACGYHFECHTVFTHWKSTLMATALKFHPGSLIKESHLFQRMFALNARSLCRSYGQTLLGAP